MTVPSGEELELQDVIEVIADARVRTIPAVTELEVALENAVAVYWAGGDSDFFIHAILGRTSADANLERVMATVRHLLPRLGTQDDLWAEMKEVFKYRNRLVHRWRHDVYGYDPSTREVTLRGSSALGSMADVVISPALTDRVVALAEDASRRLDEIANSLAELHESY